MFKRNMYASITAGIVEIILGLLICLINPEALLSFIFITVGIIIILFSIFGFMTSFQIADGYLKNESMAVSIIAFIVGMLMVIYPHSVACFIAGGFLIIYPVYKIIMAKNNHWNEFKNQWFKLLLGVIMILFGIGSTTQIVLYIVGGLVILLGICEIVYSIYLYFSLKKAMKTEKENNDVIDV